MALPFLTYLELEILFDIKTFLWKFQKLNIEIVTIMTKSKDSFIFKLYISFRRHNVCPKSLRSDDCSHYSFFVSKPWLLAKVLQAKFKQKQLLEQMSQGFVPL